MSVLSNRQVLHFRQMGYLRIPGFATDERLNELREVATALIDAREPPVIQGANGEVIRISSVWDRSEVIRSFFQSPEFKEILRSLLGPNVVFVKNRHNHLTVNGPGANDGRLHRDILQWSRGLVTAILYLESSTAENGCTKIIPGSHFLPFVGVPNNGGTWMDEHEVFSDMLDQAVEVPMEAGGMLMIDSVAFHAAGENRGRESRLSLAMGFHSMDELSSGALADHQVLVLGTQFYRGNDRSSG